MKKTLVVAAFAACVLPGAASGAHAASPATAYNRTYPLECDTNNATRLIKIKNHYSGRTIPKGTRLILSLSTGEKGLRYYVRYVTHEIGSQGIMLLRQPALAYYCFAQVTLPRIDTKVVTRR